MRAVVLAVLLLLALPGIAAAQTPAITPVPGGGGGGSGGFGGGEEYDIVAPILAPGHLIICYAVTLNDSTPGERVCRYVQGVINPSGTAMDWNTSGTFVISLPARGVSTNPNYVYRVFMDAYLPAGADSGSVTMQVSAVTALDDPTYAQACDGSFGGDASYTLPSPVTGSQIILQNIDSGSWQVQGLGSNLCGPYSLAYIGFIRHPDTQYSIDSTPWRIGLDAWGFNNDMFGGDDSVILTVAYVVESSAPYEPGYQTPTPTPDIGITPVPTLPGGGGGGGGLPYPGITPVAPIINIGITPVILPTAIADVDFDIGRPTGAVSCFTVIPRFSFHRDIFGYIVSFGTEERRVCFNSVAFSLSLDGTDVGGWFVVMLAVGFIGVLWGVLKRG